MTIHKREPGDIELLENAIRLSQVDLEKLRQGDLMNIREELLELTLVKPQINAQKDFINSLTIDRLNSIKKELGNIFQAISSASSSDPIKIDFEYNKKPTDVRFSIFSPHPSEPFRELIYIENQMDLIAISLLARLKDSKVTPNQIRRCPECSTIFLLKRKPDKNRNFYCSSKCASRAGTRAHRGRDKKELKRKGQLRGKTRTKKKPREAMRVKK